MELSFHIIVNSHGIVYVFSPSLHVRNATFSRYMPISKKAADGLAPVPWEPHCTACLNFNLVEGIGYQMDDEDVQGTRKKYLFFAKQDPGRARQNS